MLPSSPLQVLAIAFENLNILDLTGPAEVFGNLPATTRRLTIASSHETVTSSEGVTLQRHISLEDLLANNAVELENFDILVIPGAAPVHIDAALESDGMILETILKFAALSSGSARDGTGGEMRWMLSVCTGAGFLAAAGLLANKNCTAHYAYLDTLRQKIERGGGGSAAAAGVIRKRFVHVGDENGVRLVTAGGVSCGMDASLWIVREIFGMERAVTLARMMDYEWKFEGNDNVITSGYSV